MSFGFQSFTLVFSMYCASRFGWGPAEYGNVLSYCGVLHGLFHRVLLSLESRLTKRRFKRRTIEWHHHQQQQQE
jgi:hypothetical protein